VVGPRTSITVHQGALVRASRAVIFVELVQHRQCFRNNIERRNLTGPAAESGDNEGGAISSSFTLIKALSTSFPFPLSFRVPLVFPLGALGKPSSRLAAEFDRDIDGRSGSRGIVRGSKSIIDCIDDTAVIPSGAETSGTSGAVVILRAEARWARPVAELLAGHEKRGTCDVDQHRVDGQGLGCKNDTET
jgi:hypothetical protein